MSSATAEAIDLAALGKSPVRPEAPAGEDIRYDPQFEELQVEIQMALSVSGRASADWFKIVNLASAILASKSKDLTVAGYLAAGLIQTRKAEGLLLGATIFTDLVTTFWEDLYPAKTRPVGRSRALAWWIERTAAALDTLGPAGLSPAQADELRSRCEAAGEFLSSRLQDAPSFFSIIDWTRTAEARASSEPPPTMNEPRKAVAAAAEILKTSTGSVSSDTAAKQALNRMAEVARSIAAYFAADLTRPAAYRLNRVAAWIAVEELPPATDGRTLIAPPEPRMLERLAELAAQPNATALLQFCEEQIFQSIFWLDPHRHAADALSALGSPYAAAADSMRSETAAFILRLPGLKALAFADGTPFADAKTVRWLDSITAAKPAAEAVAPMEPARASDLTFEEDLKAIKQLLRSRKPLEAAQRFQLLFRACVSARDQADELLRRMAQIDFAEHVKPSA